MAEWEETGPKFILQLNGSRRSTKTEQKLAETGTPFVRSWRFNRPWEYPKINRYPYLEIVENGKTRVLTQLRSMRSALKAESLSYQVETPPATNGRILVTDITTVPATIIRELQESLS